MQLHVKVFLSMISYTNHTKEGGHGYTKREIRMDGYSRRERADRDPEASPRYKPGDTLLILGDEDRGLAIPNSGAFSELFNAAFTGEKDGEK